MVSFFILGRPASSASDLCATERGGGGFLRRSAGAKRYGHGQGPDNISFFHCRRPPNAATIRRPVLTPFQISSQLLAQESTGIALWSRVHGMAAAGGRSQGLAGRECHPIQGFAGGLRCRAATHPDLLQVWVRSARFRPRDEGATALRRELAVSVRGRSPRPASPASTCAPVAQLDRASDYGSEG